MWIKTPEDNLLNLNTGFEIGVVKARVCFSYPQISWDKTRIDNFENNYGESGYIIHGLEHFVYKEIAVFDNATDASKYLKKLAEKLGAEEI